MSDLASPVERVQDPVSGEDLALILRAGQSSPGISFVTPAESVHQLGLLCWPKGHVIDAHIHNPIQRSINSTQEVLFIRSGRVRLDLYRNDTTYLSSTELLQGDVVFLASGGHGFEILEDSDIVEVKQGPYAGEGEKTRFSPANNPFWRTANE